MKGFASQNYEGIVTCDGEQASILHSPIPFLTEKEWALAESTVQRLLSIRENVLKGGAGLAAPQIGILQPIFIYSPDRTTENIRIVINPTFEPLGHEKREGAEACFSVPLRCTTLIRWKAIKVRYQTLDREWVQKELQDFEAKVFQHEMDHILGKLTIDHEGAEIITFTEADSFQNHMKKIHLEDSKTYKVRTK